MNETIHPDDEREPLTDEERQHWMYVRIERIVTDGMVRRETCPKCGALPGEDCRSPKFYVGSFHRGRKDAAGVR